MYRIVPIVPAIESKVQQQQEVTADYEKKQSETMEAHALRNKKTGERLMEDAKECEDKGIVDDCTDFYSEAGNQLIKATEKICKAALVANNKEDAKYGKNNDKNVLQSHSATVINNALGTDALLTKEDAAKSDNITGNSGLDYINTEYGNRNNDVVSLDKNQVEELQNITNKAFDKFEENKQKAKVQKERQQMVSFITDLVDNL
ncbi:hypothetical protein [Anaerocolumna sp. MB42-C2]|uniref:hypothetical protein n=1 Tax=Anaerocolumna sp. MB42-C2 TaxID=3070997 RepID=UPI0027E09BA6|nr:hypothetical protein [Anaerocolumna sp. MB42-C2]WMJ89450.1 hypothetical protein RBU59_07975 [Anaerocolumna sp. MB42-C2]